MIRLESPIHWYHFIFVTPRRSTKRTFCVIFRLHQWMEALRCSSEQINQWYSLFTWNSIFVDHLHYFWSPLWITNVARNLKRCSNSWVANAILYWNLSHSSSGSWCLFLDGRFVGDLVDAEKSWQVRKHNKVDENKVWFSSVATVWMFYDRFCIVTFDTHLYWQP